MTLRNIRCSIRFTKLIKILDDQMTSVEFFAIGRLAAKSVVIDQLVVDRVADCTVWPTSGWPTVPVADCTEWPTIPEAHGLLVVLDESSSTPEKSYTDKMVPIVLFYIVLGLPFIRLLDTVLTHIQEAHLNKLCRFIWLPVSPESHLFPIVSWLPSQIRVENEC
uniref:Uncharacterized protein n=1 Tax=Romanomermis culicivorax TaxID=13658 RepID=A0A915K3A0_ROMCU